MTIQHHLPSVAERAVVPPSVGPGEPPTEQSPASASPPPSSGLNRWAVALVLGTMVLAAVLFVMGYTVGAVLGLLAGAAYLGLEIVDRLSRPKGGA